VVWDCFDYLQMWPNLFVNYIIRIRNAAAHALVSLVRNLCSRSWVGNVHEPINRIICNFVLNLFLLWRNYPFFNKELTFFFVFKLSIVLITSYQCKTHKRSTLMINHIFDRNRRINHIFEGLAHFLTND
jgi:hypothetical protein